MSEEKAAEDQKLDLRNGAHMSFFQHLEELRRRLIICFIAVAAGFVICYSFAKPIFRLLTAPLIKLLPEGQTMVYTGLPEAFITYLKVGLWGGLVLALPVVFYQLWGFIAPGLYRNERSYVIPFVFCSMLLFIVGAVFGYLVVFPLGFRFFLGFSDETMRALPAVAQYFSLSLKFLFGFGLIFELPVIMVFLARMGLVRANFLSRQRKYAILLIFVIGAVLTPPDVISQMLMALPLYILYEISILLVRVVQRKPEETEAAQETPPQA